MTDYDNCIYNIKSSVDTAIDQILKAEGYLRRGMPGCAVSHLINSGRIASRCGESLYQVLLEKERKNKEVTK